MCRRKIGMVLLSLTLMISISFIGCSEEKVQEGKKELENRAEEIDDNLKEGIDEIGDSGHPLWNKVKDFSMGYNEDDFEGDMRDKGYRLVELEESQSLLSVENDDYSLNGDRISIYEYDANASKTLEGDIKSITEDGTVINGNKPKWSSSPHIYKKGRVIVIYDGKNESILTVLKEILGDPIL